MALILTRTEVTPDGVFGVLKLPNGQVLRTMEDDWKDNQPNESCIPAGVYGLRRTMFHKHHYETFQVMDVDGRDNILIHIANTENDVQGCIGVGMRVGYLWVRRDEDTGQRGVTKRAVVESKEAFAEFMQAMRNRDRASLIVRWSEAINPEGVTA
jgi:hypothetical protein